MAGKRGVALAVVALALYIIGGIGTFAGLGLIGLGRTAMPLKVVRSPAISQTSEARRF